MLHLREQIGWNTGWRKVRNDMQQIAECQMFPTALAAGFDDELLDRWRIPVRLWLRSPVRTAS